MVPGKAAKPPEPPLLAAGQRLSGPAWRPRTAALVGASGTGKSHRAVRVAYENDIDVIIDDGLVVRDGKILAGRSAKAESTRVAAIKRAIFADPEHALEVRCALAEAKPTSLLILGTSLDMIGRIAASLELPVPDRVIRIEEVASERDIGRARRVRREQGKHVIPAPTLEVRKTFQGYLVDPLRFFLRPKGGVSFGPAIEKSVVRPTWSSLGRFYINDTVIMSIALRAARDVEGVARPLRARIEASDAGTTIDLELAIWLGADIVGVCQGAQLQVRKIVEHTTGLRLPAVNVIARALMIPEAAPSVAAGRGDSDDGGH